MPIGAAEAAKDKGNAAFKAGDLPLALANYTTAIALDPSSSVYLNNRSLVHLKLKQWHQAEADASKAYGLDPASAKALYRRGLARAGRGGKVEQAREDFIEALKLGGGPEVKAELDKLPPKASPPPKSTTTSEPIASATDPSTAQTNRLRAALAQRPATAAPASPPRTVQPQQNTASPPAKRASPLPPNELFREVSTRRLTPPPSAGGGSSFAQKKEQRQTRIGSGFGGVKNAASTAASAPTSTAAPPEPSQAKPTTPSPPPAAAAPPPPSTTESSLPAVAFDKLSLAEQEIALSPAWQSMAETKYSLPLPSTPPTPSAPSSISRAASPAEAPPASWAEFEREWTSHAPLSPARTVLLQRIRPYELSTLFGDALTPDLLSDIVKSIGAGEGDELSWKVNFLQGLNSCRRFDVALMFMDEADKVLIRGLIARAQEQLGELQKGFGLQPLTLPSKAKRT